MSPTAAKLFRKAEILREFLPRCSDAIAGKAYARLLVITSTHAEQ